LSSTCSTSKVAIPSTYVAPNSTVVATSTPSGISLSNGAGAIGGQALGLVAAAAVAVACFAL
jgi:hypothetical protein